MVGVFAASAADARAPISGQSCVAARVEVVATPPPPALERSLGVVTFAWDFLVDLGPEGLALVPRASLVIEAPALAGDVAPLDPCPAELLPLVARAPLGARVGAREVVVAAGDEVALEGELRPLPPAPDGPRVIVASPRLHLSRRGPPPSS